MQNTWSPQQRLRSRIFPITTSEQHALIVIPQSFFCLPTCSVNETVEPSIDAQNSISENPIVVPTEITWNRRPKWEWQTKLVIALAEDGSTSLKLMVELETTDTEEVKSVNSFVDSRATREFIDCHYTKSNRLHTQKLSKPIPVYNVDGTLNEAGSITEVVDLILRYQNHSEWTLFTVTDLGKQKLILGHSWRGLYTPPCIPIGLRSDYQTPLGLHSDCSEFFLAEVSAKFLIPVQAYPNGVQTETRKERIPVKESLNGLNLSLVISISLNI